MVEALATIHRERCGEDLRIGVVHWVTEMPDIAAGLSAVGYSRVGAEWVTVISLTPDAVDASSPGRRR